jgi:Uma2 family endonuclease
LGYDETMGIPKTQTWISPEDYLSGEPLSEIRHEYIDGEVFAMAGGTPKHNVISGNFHAHLWSHLRGKPCRVFIADVKVRIIISQQDIFYYPDVLVACDPNDDNEQFLRAPKLIIEVLSKSTHRLDRNEKFRNYITLPSLEEYVIAEQERPCLMIHRRSNQWVPEVIEDLAEMVRLESVGLELPLAAFYENVVPPLN